MKIAYIMRGIPGSGKSTIARELAGETGVIHSTDDFFMVGGSYRFNPELLSEYHHANYRAFCASLAAGIEVVICDNTNSQPRHYTRYVKSAEAAGYRVVFVTMPHPDPATAAQRTTHGVPLYAIERTLREWEN